MGIAARDRTHRERFWAQVLAVLFVSVAVLYVGSFYVWKYLGLRTAREYELKGYYFRGIAVHGELSVGESVVRVFYFPLIWIDVNWLGGDGPAAPVDSMRGVAPIGVPPAAHAAADGDKFQSND